MEKLTYGMIGGGRGAFIGAVHRIAAELDHGATLAAGALSSDLLRAKASGEDLGLDPARTHGSWRELLESERARDPGDRIDFVSIVTPNDSHFEIAEAFAAAGFHVVLDKPMTVTIEQAERLTRVVRDSGVVFAVTYNYTGYPLVRQARQMIQRGELGAIRRVIAEYHQGWLATPLEQTGQKQASWRTDPKRAGVGGSVGDIGSHAENLISFVTGLEMRSLCAQVSTFVEGRAIDDDAAVLIRFGGGAVGTLSCSQVCVGEENGLTLRVYGEKGGLSWKQENPNELIHAPIDAPRRILTRGGPGLGERATSATRIPAGHPEGYLEGFANLYREVIAEIRARKEATSSPCTEWLVPTVEDGARGVRFIHAVIESGNAGGRWVDLG